MRKIIKCPICTKTFLNEEGLETHINKKHYEQLNGISSKQFLFNLRNKKDSGRCIMYEKVKSCKINTTFNEKTGKYNRICDNPVCKEEYVKEFKNRMKKKYGSEHLLNDPKKQREMLSQRRISGEYVWSDGTKFLYTGTYEKEFLKFMDLLVEWPSYDIISPAPINVKYDYENETLFYIPDFYIPTLNLIIEIKGTNGHYEERDREKQLTKDKALNDSSFNYLKILDKDYNSFIVGLRKNIWKVKEKDRVLKENSEITKILNFDVLNEHMIAK